MCGRLCRFTALFLSFCLGGPGDPAWGAETRVYSFNMAGGYALRHPVTQGVLLPWAERIKQRTGGQVVINYFAPNALGPEVEHFEMVRKGRVDIGHNFFARNPGRFPVSAVADLPDSRNYPPAASVALWRMYHAIPEIQKEFEGVKLIGLHVSSSAQFCWAAKEEITRAGQVKGKKLLVSGGDAARVVRHMGGVPFVVPGVDFHSSFARNMADGCVLPLADLRAWNLVEDIKSITLAGYSAKGWWIAMNPEAWNRLPPELQKVIEEESGEKLAFMLGRVQMESDQLEEDYLRTSGVVLHQVNQASKMEWLEYTLTPLKEEWFRKMTNRRLSAQSIFDASRAILQECVAEFSEKH